MRGIQTRFELTDKKDNVLLTFDMEYQSRHENTTKRLAKDRPIRCFLIHDKYTPYQKSTTQYSKYQCVAFIMMYPHMKIYNCKISTSREMEKNIKCNQKLLSYHGWGINYSDLSRYA